MIEVQGLEKRFGEIRAVDGIDLRAEDGRITGLLGPNGAGKSTTLRIISTVMKPGAGKVVVDGLNAVERPRAVRLRIGVLPHQAGLYPRLSGRENIVYYGRLAGLRGAELAARVEELVKRLEMEAFIDRRAKGYSQGQRLKTSLARALVHDPKNIILDEPTSGLDVMATRALRDIIRDLRSRGHCVLFSSHIMQEVAALCDEIVIIAHGLVVARGTPDSIRRDTGTEDLEEAFVRAIARAEEVNA
jgi:sodium transport system ATP-binding protein